MNIFKSFGLYAVGQGINSGIRFILIPYYSFLLSVEDFGKVGIVWMILPVMMLFIGFGATSTVFLKYYKIDEHMRDRFINFVFIATFSLFLLNLLIVMYSYFFLERMFLLDVEKSIYAKLVCAAYGAFLVEFILSWFKIRIQPKKFVLYNTMYTILSISFILYYLIVLKGGFLGFINGTLYGNLSMAVVLLSVYIYSCKTYEWKIPAALKKSILYLGGPVVLTLIISNVLAYSGRYVLVQLATMTDVGIYTMGTRLGDAIYSFFVTPFLTAVTPILFKLAAEDEMLFVSEMKRYFNLYLLVGLFLVLFANSILGIVFHFFIHEQYEGSILVAQMSFWGILIFGLSQQVGAVNVIQERMPLITVFSVSTGILNLSLSYFFVPIFGVLGAVISSLISYTFVFFLQYISSQRKLYIPYDPPKALCFFGIALAVFLLQNMVDFMIQIWWCTAVIKIFLVIVTVYIVHYLKLYDELDFIVEKIKSAIYKPV
jgi:polysaccharide biosynthesis protein